MSEEPSRGSQRCGSDGHKPLEVLLVAQENSRVRLLAALIDGTPSSEIRYSVVALSGKPGPLAQQLEQRGVRLYSLGLKHVTMETVPLGVVRLRRLIQETKPDVIQPYLFYASLTTAIARATMKYPGAVLLVRHHNAIQHLERRRLHVMLDSWMARRADCVVAVSDAVRRTLVEGEEVSADRVEVVYNGLDWERAVRVNPEQRDSWRSRYEGQRLLVAAGRLVPMKDHDTMLRALARVLSRHPDVRLLLAGAGAPKRRRELLSTARSLGVQDHFEFLGWVPDVYDLMAAADVFVQSSFDESFCQTVIEAAGLGVPVATTTVGPLADMTRGWHPQIDAYDDGALADRICRLLDDPVRARAEAATTAVEVRATYTMQGMAAGYRRVYERMMGPVTDRASSQEQAADEGELTCSGH